MKKKQWAIWGMSATAIMLVAGLVACAPAANEEATEPEQEPVTFETPEADQFGVVTADAWKDIFPNQYATYQKNEANSPDSGKHNYLELYPALNTMYKGYGFAKGYDEASSHLYTLDSIQATPRVNDKTLANCITCKTPQFTAMVNAEGDATYAKPFAELIGEFDEPISCYNCHENDPQSLTVASKFFLTSLGDDTKTVPAGAQVCGQCHNEYYFNPETKATTNPYVGTANMTPDAILAYYDEKDFKDWEHPDTGAPMIKVQHPEFETVYGGKQSHMAGLDYSCSNCHMGEATAEDGSKYTSHNWVSPLENEELLKNDCNSCHKDLKAEVAEIQKKSEERVVSISEKIAEYTDKLAAAKDSLSADDLAKAQKLQRNAQFYWDFVMVENSEGAHNPDFADETLDKAEAAVDEGLAMFA